MSKRPTVVTPPVATRATVAVRSVADTEGDGFVGDVMRGWEVYDDPDLVAARKEAHERKLSEARSYFIAQLAK